MSASGNAGAGSPSQPGGSSPAALSPKPAAAASAQKKESFYQRWLRTPLLIAASIGIFTVLEHWGADLRLFAELRRIGFDWTSHLAGVEVLSPIDEDLPVVLVDISDLNLADADDNPSPNHYAPEPGYTPRSELEKIARLLGRATPKAIGFDIDLSGDPNKDNGRPPTKHEHFLLTSLDMTNAAWDYEGVRYPKVPIFLGVGRGMWHGDKAHWLGRNMYADLAAGVYLASDQDVIYPPAYSLVPLKFRLGAKPDASAAGKSAPPAPVAELKSLSVSLAEKLGEPDHRHQPPKFLQERLFVNKRTLTVKRSKLGVGEIDAFYINFASLNSLSQTRLRARDLPGMKISDLKAKIGGKVVIVGDADLERSGDKLVVPGQRRVVPGIYAHAAAVITLHHTPLWNLDPPSWYIGSHHVGYLAGVLLGFAISITAVIITHRLSFLHGHRARHHVVHLTLTLFGMLAVAIFFAMAWNVIWIGCIGGLVGAVFDLAFVLWFDPRDSAGHGAPAHAS